MERNNEIGKLIKDSLTSFEVSPNDDLWNKIEADLKQEKKRKAMPLWYYISALGTFAIILTFFSQIFAINDKFVNTNNQNQKINQSDNTSQANDTHHYYVPKSNRNENHFKSDYFSKKYTNSNTTNSKTDFKVNNTDSSSRTEYLQNFAKSIFDKENITKDEKLNNKKSIKSKLNKNGSHSLLDKPRAEQEVRIKYIEYKNKKIVDKSKTIKVIKETKDYTTIEVVDKYTVRLYKKNFKNEFKKNYNTQKTILTRSKTKHKDNYASLKKKNNNILTNKHLNNQVSDSVINKKITSNDSFKSIEQKTTDLDGLDSVLKKQIKTKNNIKKNAKKKDSLIEIIENKRNKTWSFTPFIASSLVKDFKNESIIGSHFDNLKNKSKLTLNYGLYLSYRNNKYSFRTGMIKNKIFVSTDLNNFEGSFSDINLNDDFNYKTPSSYNESNLNQIIEYYEIPLEVTYTFKEYKRFSFDAIIGGSYLFIDKNDVYLVNASGDKTNIGSANKIINQNLSINTGIITKYKINNSLFLIVSPMFKSYLKLPSNKIFSTYQFTIQTGLECRF